MEDVLDEIGETEGVLMLSSKRSNFTVRHLGRIYRSVTSRECQRARMAAGCGSGSGDESGTLRQTKPH